MNRLAPMIERPLRIAAAFPAPQARAVTRAVARPAPPQWLDDARLFASGWVGGLVVFGTFLA